MVVVLDKNTQVGTQEWTSDAGKGHINDTHLSYTCVVMGETLWNLTPGVYTEELSGLKIKSRGNSQLDGGRAMGNDGEENYFWLPILSETKLKSRVTREWNNRTKVRTPGTGLQIRPIRCWTRTSYIPVPLGTISE